MMTTTGKETIVESESERVANWLINAEELLRYLGVNPTLVPHLSLCLVLCVDDIASLVTTVRTAGGTWDKDDSYGFLSLTRSFGPHSIRVSTPKAPTCERIQVGTRHVDAIEAYEEPVYEWVCPDSLLSEVATGDGRR